MKKNAKISALLIFTLLVSLFISFIRKEDTNLNKTTMQNEDLSQDSVPDADAISSLGFILPSSFTLKNITLEKIELEDSKRAITYELKSTPQIDIGEYKDIYGINNPKSLWKYSVYQSKVDGEQRQLTEINKMNAIGVSVADKFEARDIKWVYFNGAQPYVVGYRKFDKLYISITPMFYWDSTSGKKQIMQDIYTLSKGI